MNMRLASCSQRKRRHKHNGTNSAVRKAVGWMGWMGWTGCIQRLSCESRPHQIYADVSHPKARLDMDVGVFDFRSTSGLVGAVKAVEEGAAVLALLPRDIWRWFIAHAREWRAAETNAEKREER